MNWSNSMTLMIFGGMIAGKGRTQDTEVSAMKPEPESSELGVSVFTRLFEKMHEGVLLVDSRGAVKWANPAAAMLHGCDRSDELESTSTEYRQRFVLRDSDNRKLPAGDCPLARLANGKSFTRIQAWLSRKNDVEQQRLLEFSSLALTAPDGTPGPLPLSLTGPKPRLPKTKRQPQSWNSIPCTPSNIRMDDSRFIMANDGFVQLTGLGHERLSALPLRELDILRDAERRSEAIEALAAWHSIEPQESTAPTCSGERRHIILAGQPVMIDGRKCMLFTCHDQDARKRTLISLRERNWRYARVFQLAPLSMLICRRAE